MINKTNYDLGNTRSVIRELFECGKKLKAEIGEENVFDFSLGNPSVPAPEEVKRALLSLIENGDPVALHGYTSAQGDYSVREKIAENLRKKYGANVSADGIYMTCGAAASLTITLNAILNAGDEVAAFAPFFPEYGVFCEHAGGKLAVIPCEDKTFAPDVEKLKAALNPKVKAVIINSPNNPSGVVYSEAQIKALCAALEEHRKNTGNTVYLISDEPYREIVFDKTLASPFIMNYYADSIVCYSYSKSLSLPGERIGYIAVNGNCATKNEVYTAVCGAGRALGYVCAPSLFQRLVAETDGVTADISAYKTNRDTLYSALTDCGFTAVKPEGAFYLFVKSPEGDAAAFSERAKKLGLLIVPSDSFGVKGYARISYCVSAETVMRSLPAFKALAKSYGL